MEDVSASSCYDLHCRDGRRQLGVEVKGTSLDDAAVLLPPNEVEHARTHSGRMELFVVSNIELRRSNGEKVACGGEIRILAPWKIEECELEPTGYRCYLPAVNSPSSPRRRRSSRTG